MGRGSILSLGLGTRERRQQHEGPCYQAPAHTLIPTETCLGFTSQDSRPWTRCSVSSGFSSFAQAGLV